jgi:hypothetical protein
MIVFGGQADAVAVNDVWELALDGGGAWFERQPHGAPHPAGPGATMVYDSMHDRAILYGGGGGGAVTHFLSLREEPGAWTLLPVAGRNPGGRSNHTAIFDPVNGDMIVASAQSGTIPFAILRVGGGRWLDVTIDPPVNGTVSKTPNMSCYDVSSAQIEAFPTSGWVFVGWSGDVHSTENPLTVDLSSSRSVVAHFAPSATGVGQQELSFALADVAPSPSTGAVRFAWTLPAETDVSVRVLDVAGRAVARIADGRQTRGQHEAAWNAGRLQAGIYFVQCRAGGRVAVKRFVLVP